MYTVRQGERRKQRVLLRTAGLMYSLCERLFGDGLQLRCTYNITTTLDKA